MATKGVIEEKLRKIRLQHSAREMMVTESYAELESITREKKLIDLLMERSEFLESLKPESTYVNDSSKLRRQTLVALEETEKTKFEVWLLLGLLRSVALQNQS